MPTTILLSVADTEAGKSAVVQVEEPFNVVMEVLLPSTAPTSADEARMRHIFTDAHTGTRLFVRPELMALVREEQVTR